MLPDNLDVRLILDRGASATAAVLPSELACRFNPSGDGHSYSGRTVREHGSAVSAQRSEMKAMSKLACESKRHWSLSQSQQSLFFI